MEETHLFHLSWKKIMLRSTWKSWTNISARGLMGYMGHDGMHPQLLRKLADATVKPLSVIFGRSRWLEECPED